jgi:hypothetical protein
VGFGALDHDFDQEDQSQEDRREDEPGGNGSEDGRWERPVTENLEHISGGNGGEDGSQEDSEDIPERRGRRMGRRRRRRRRPGSNCKRGGLLWTSSAAVEDSQGLPECCAKVLASLSTQGNLLSVETSTALDSQPRDIIEMRKMLSGESWKEIQVAFQVNSLENIILRCQGVERVEVGIQFISMVNFIQLAAKVERYVCSFRAFN